MATATYTALVLLEFELEKEPSLGDASRLQETLVSATRKFAKVTKLVFLQPDEGVKVTSAVEEVEDEAEGNLTTLHGKPFRRAADVIRILLATRAQVTDVKFCHKTNILSARVQYPSGVAPFEFKLLPETIASILGK